MTPNFHNIKYINKPSLLEWDCRWILTSIHRLTTIKLNTEKTHMICLKVNLFSKCFANLCFYEKWTNWIMESITAMSSSVLVSGNRWSPLTEKKYYIRWSASIIYFYNYAKCLGRYINYVSDGLNLVSVLKLLKVVNNALSQVSL